MTSEKTDIWMPVYIGDYLADTADLNAEHSGCYLHWLMHYWRKGPLPDDIRALVLIGKLDSENTTAIVRALLEKYFYKGSDGLWHQKRADKEKAKSEFYRDRASLGGQARAEKAARNSRGRFAPASPASKPASHQLDDQLESSTSPSPLPLPLPKNKRLSNASHSHPTAEADGEQRSVQDECELIYQAYPKHMDKQAALLEIAKALKKIPYVELLTRVERFAQKVKTENTEKRYIKHPHRWFKAGSYEDEDLKPPPKYDVVEVSPDEWWGKEKHGTS
jgi:uncharacterized protein YdaU (DUF1376 family)